MADATRLQGGDAAMGLASVLTVSVASSLIMLDSNIVAVSLLTIGRSFGTSFTGLQWVVSAYVLSFCALLLAAGSYADGRGRRHAILAGLVVFGSSSLGCGLAGSILVLDLFRVAQGVGAALLLTASLAIISHDNAGAARARAFAIWGASIGVALASGPIVGGIVTQWLGWRAIFLVNVPLCGLLLAVTTRTVAESRDPGARRLDWPGVLSFSAGLGLLIYALIAGNDLGWGSRRIVLCLCLAAATLAAFLRLEAGKDGAMVDLALFRGRAFVGAITAMVGYGATLQVLIFLLPLYLQTVCGFAPMAAGLAMVPFALPMVVAPRFSAGLAARLSTSSLLACGLLLGMGGELACAVVARAALPYPWFAAGMAIAGSGAGLLNGLTVKAVQSSVPDDRAGVASGMAATARFIGLLVSMAGLGAILAGGTRAALDAGIRERGIPTGTVGDLSRLVISGDLESLRGSGDATRELAIRAYATGFSTTMLATAAAALVAAGLAWVLLRRPQHGDLPPRCMPIDCRHPV